MLRIPLHRWRMDQQLVGVEHHLGDAARCETRDAAGPECQAGVIRPCVPQRRDVFADVLVSLTAAYTGGRFVNNLDGSDQTHRLLNDLGWEISPSGFGAMLRDLRSRYGLPVLVLRLS